MKRKETQIRNTTKQTKKSQYWAEVARWVNIGKQLLYQKAYPIMNNLNAMWIKKV